MKAEILIKAGTIIKIDGEPFELVSDTVVLGFVPDDKGAKVNYP